MLATELQGKTKTELKELLLLNTERTKVDDGILSEGIQYIYEVLLETESSLNERQAFWQMVLHGVFGIDAEITMELFNQIGTFELILFCEENLGKRKEIELYESLYKAYYDRQESLSYLLNKVVGAFIEDLSDIKPEEISRIIGELNLNLEQLPDFIKDSLK
jgi:hypothetical protein